ncbi:uncharacterized protein V6R79_011986 [Siganus canaliculatus]
MKDLGGLFDSRFNSNIFLSSFVSLAVFLPLPLVGSIGFVEWLLPLKRAPSHSLYLMRKTSADIPAFLGVRCRFNNKTRRARNTIPFRMLLSLSLNRLLSARLFIFRRHPNRKAAKAARVSDRGALFTWQTFPRALTSAHSSSPFESTSPLLPSVVRSPSSAQAKFLSWLPRGSSPGPWIRPGTRGPGVNGVRIRLQKRTRSSLRSPPRVKTPAPDSNTVFTHQSERRVSRRSLTVQFYLI